jgi:hypothetical protein
MGCIAIKVSSVRPAASGGFSHVVSFASILLWLETGCYPFLTVGILSNAVIESDEKNNLQSYVGDKAVKCAG